MVNLSEINEIMKHYSYIIKYELLYSEDYEKDARWVLILDISDKRSYFGNIIHLKLIDVCDLRIKSPNIGICCSFELSDVRNRKLEKIHYYFEDCEEEMISCYCYSVEVNGVVI